MNVAKKCSLNYVYVTLFINYIIYVVSVSSFFQNRCSASLNRVIKDANHVVDTVQMEMKRYRYSIDACKRP